MEIIAIHFKSDEVKPFHRIFIISFPITEQAVLNPGQPYFSHVYHCIIVKRPVGYRIVQI